MATVIDDDTGEEVEVRQVEAVATVASINTLGSEFPKEAAKAIEQAMVWAVQKAAEEGITDPDEVRALMLKARQDMKVYLRSQMNDLRSQQV